MRLLVLPLLLLGLGVSAGASAEPADRQTDGRVAASFLVALGRLPDAEERADWSNGAEKPAMTDLLRRHRERLQQDATLQERIAAKARRDVYGDTTDARGAVRLPATATYYERAQAHLETLRRDPAAYEAVIRRAYPLVIGREVYPEEIAYWKKYDALPYVLLAAAIENWARRNQPGLMVTAGTPTISEHSLYLDAVGVSPAVAAELRTELRLPVPLSGAGDRNLIAPGASQLITNGHRHVVAAGTVSAEVFVAVR